MYDIDNTKLENDLYKVLKSDKLGNILTNFASKQDKNKEGEEHGDDKQCINYPQEGN